MTQAIFDKFTADTRAKLIEAVDKYNLPFDPLRVKIRYDIKGRCAGQARHRAGVYELRFNPEAILNHNEDMTKDTIPHEVAHLVCFARRELGNGHDAGWKRVCRQLGGDDSRTHDMTLTKAKEVARYKYTMPNGKVYNLAGKQHNSIQNGTRSYRCRETGVALLPEFWEGYKTLAQRLAMVDVPRFQMNSNGGMSKVAGDASKSKADIAREVFEANPNISRGEFIEIMVVKANMTKAGAGTYYYNLKKK